jgi:hypothetical protein
MRKSLLAGSSCGLLLVALVATPAQAAPVTPAACTVAAPAAAATGDTNRISGARGVEDVPGYAQWLGQDRGQAFNHAVHRAVDSALGAAKAKEPIADQLRRGLIGTAFDHNTQTVVVVATPEYRAVPALRSRLAAAAGATRATGMKVNVIIGCHSATQLIAAADLLAARVWHPDAARARFTYSLQASDSAFHVWFDQRYPQAAQALRDALGDRAVVNLSDNARTGRYNDGEPHFGGAAVRVGAGTTSNNTCSTGFTVRRNVDGWRGAISAAHCFNNNAAIYSGPEYTGIAWGKVSYPAYDIIGIKSSTEKFDNTIHSDPCCPTQRNIIGRSYADVGVLVCFSGMSTKATCNIQVTSTNGYFCDAAGCTGGLIEAMRNGELIVRPGDSGGPIYTRSGTSNAYGAGMIIAGAAGGTIAYGEHLGVIESYLNVSLLTS